MHANEWFFLRGEFFLGWVGVKGFLDGWGGVLRVAGMKTLLNAVAVLMIAGVLGSCGLPMAALRSVGNLPNTAANAVNEAGGLASAFAGGL